MKKIRYYPLLFIFLIGSCSGFKGWSDNTNYEKAKIAGHSTNVIYDALMTTVADEIQVLVKKHSDTGSLTPAEKTRLESLNNISEKISGYEYVNRAYLIAMDKWQRTGDKPVDMGIIIGSIKDYADLFNEIATEYDLFK